MEFREVLRRRRMVREYDPDRPLSPEVVDRIVAHALRAPSAGFSQGWGFLVLTDKADLDLFWEVSTFGKDSRSGRTAAASILDEWLAGMSTAPLVVVAHSHKDAYLDRYARPDKGWTDRAEDRWPVPYWDIDAGMASLLMLLTAVDEGLGACLFGIQPENHDAYREAFGVPGGFVPVGAVSVGYAADTVTPERRASIAARRRPVAEVVHRGRWSAQLAADDQA
ncbi:nitroreductase family protein [Longispora sp. K20-0274]|uniref:nitroreductase family protein n=1 Tax=Longispora sp. K20-0274 TaxID=3088255 RepID=UPI00399A4F52